MAYGELLLEYAHKTDAALVPFWKQLEPEWMKMI